MIKEVDIQGMKKLLDEGAVLVDVREDEEVADGFIEGMQHMPLSSFEDYEHKVAKDRPTVFYCRSGKRSLKAAEIASLWTKQPLYSLKGGYLEYSSQENRG